MRSGLAMSGLAMTGLAMTERGPQAAGPGDTVLVFGLGYSGAAIAEAAQSAGFQVTGTTRSGLARSGLARSGLGASIPFDAAETAIQSATHLLTTAGPDAAGDPVLVRYAAAIAAAPGLRWIGYLSTTGVYGDRGGDWAR